MARSPLRLWCCLPAVFGVVLTLLTAMFVPATAYAGDVALSVTLNAVDDHVSVQVTNSGRDTARAVTVTLTLAGQSWEQPVVSELPPAGTVAALFVVDVPRVQGSYPLYALISYRNGGVELSSAHVGLFNVRREAVMPHECPLLDRVVRSSASYELRPPADSVARLYTAPEFSVVEVEGGRATVYAQNTSDLQLQSPVFAVYERHSTRLHETAICRGSLTVPSSVHARSLFPHWFVVAAFLVATALSFVWHGRAQETGAAEERVPLLIRSRAAFVIAAWSLALLFYRLFPWVPDALVRNCWLLVGGKPAAIFERWIQPLFFDSANYAPFFRFLADPLYLYVLLGHYFALRWSARRAGALQCEDKLYSLIAVCFTSRRKAALPIPGAGIAARALLVKSIFLPLLGSWMIATGLLVLQLAAAPALSGEWLYGISYHSLLLIDVTIFAASYFIELPALRNQIRSVEPTLLGWLVCLACYPPLNDLLLVPIDHPLFGYAPEWPVWIRGAASTVIIGLWAIYVWATVALGWKASNLTHRGIVQTGPYRYCRHPAYAAKLTIWTLSGIFLGLMTIPLLAALIALYGLRMGTEERHLAIDSEYRAYMKRVPWRVLPGKW